MEMTACTMSYDISMSHIWCHKLLQQTCIARPELTHSLLLAAAGPLLDWLVHVTAMGAFTAAHTLASPLRSALHATSDCTDKLSGQHNQPQGSSTTSQGGPLASWVAGLNPRQRYRLARVLEGLEYGAGLDYKL
jgi:hypothetical protein